MYQLISLQTQDGIATLTLDDPERRNAQSQAMGREFADAVARIKADPEVRVLVITGAGKAFCAGGDLDMLSDMLGADPEANRRTMLAFYRYFLCVTELEIPTIAAINGAAIGAGLSFALGCDLRIASQTAKLGFTYLNLGLHPGMGTHFLLPRLVGVARAFELVSTGAIIDGQAAERIGLVNRAVPASDVLSTAMELAIGLKAQPDGALRTAKRILYQGLIEGLQNSLEMDAIAQTMSFASPEMRSRLTALRSQAAGPRS